MQLSARQGEALVIFGSRSWRRARRRSKIRARRQGVGETVISSHDDRLNPLIGVIVGLSSDTTCLVAWEDAPGAFYEVDINSLWLYSGRA
jgi:hypothetical protein